MTCENAHVSIYSGIQEINCFWGLHQRMKWTNHRKFPSLLKKNIYIYMMNKRKERRKEKWRNKDRKKTIGENHISSSSLRKWLHSPKYSQLQLVSVQRLELIHQTTINQVVIIKQVYTVYQLFTDLFVTVFLIEVWKVHQKTYNA